jgi:Glycosyl transferases group 1/DUF based on E. rectale Gene description (DUF3880)
MSQPMTDLHRPHLRRVMSSARSRVGSFVLDRRALMGWRRLLTTRRSRTLHARRSSAPRSPIPVDSILDEFSEHAFEHEVTLKPLGRRTARSTDAVMLLAESAWLGSGGRWRHQFSHFEPGNALDRCVDRYRDHAIPSVFWNKEDPAHFDVFLPVARRFDYVFTTDANCVDRYRAELGHDRVAVLPFAAQPALHNPIGRDASSQTICFAGAWRGDVHPQRIDQLTTILDAALDVGGLRIFARRPAAGRAEFPERYRSAIVGEIPYSAMNTEYRRHACFLNVNTVTNSPTMLSRRVFEILACRTPVVSAPSMAIENLFEGVVLTPTTRAQTSAVLAELVHDSDRRDRLGQLGFRTVVTSHTYQHRVRAICDAAGVPDFPAPPTPTVDGVIEIDSMDDVSRALATAEPLRNCLQSIVIVCRDADERASMQIESRNDVALVRVGHATTGEILGRLPGLGEFVAFLDINSRYGAFMVSDAMLATRFADADVYGKSTSHAGVGDGATRVGDGQEFCETTDVIAGTAIVRRRTLALAPAIRGPEATLSRSAIAASNRRFAVDRFNHLSASPHTSHVDHTCLPLSEIFF